MNELQRDLHINRGRQRTLHTGYRVPRDESWLTCYHGDLSVGSAPEGRGAGGGIPQQEVGRRKQLRVLPVGSRQSTSTIPELVVQSHQQEKGHGCREPKCSGNIRDSGKLKSRQQEGGK